MPCRNIRFEIESDNPEQEWVPMALREAVCALRRSNPEKWNQALRCEGVEIDDEDIHCLHNLEGSFRRCPLHAERSAQPAGPKPPAEEPQDEHDEDHNEHGYPLKL